MNSIPERLRDDAKVLTRVDNVLRLGLEETAPRTGERIPPGAGTVPGPNATVFHIAKNPVDTRDAPAASIPNRMLDALAIELPNDGADRDTSGVLLEDPTNDRRLGGADLLIMAVIAHPAAPVDTRLTNRLRTVAERAFTNGKAPPLLSKQTAERLFSEVRKVKLVDSTANVDHESRFVIVRVETIGNRNEPNSQKMELSEHGLHEEVVASQSGQVVHEDDRKEPLLGVSTQGQEPRPINRSARGSGILVDMRIEHHQVGVQGEAPTRSDLVGDALLALV